MRFILIAVTLCLSSAPLLAQGTPAASTGSRITNAGVERAAATVDSVFVEKRTTGGQVDVGDFTAYLLARLGVPAFDDSLAFRVTSDSTRIRIRGRIMDFPTEVRAELGPLLSFIDSTSTVLAEISLPQRENGVMRFRLERLIVRDIPVPDFLIQPALAEYARRYPVLTSGGREFLVAMPPEATVGIGWDVLELRMPAKKPANSERRTANRD